MNISSQVLGYYPNTDQYIKTSNFIALKPLI